MICYVPLSGICPLEIQSRFIWLVFGKSPPMPAGRAAAGRVVAGLGAGPGWKRGAVGDARRAGDFGRGNAKTVLVTLLVAGLLLNSLAV
jgi:hypothetical protein